MSAHGGKSACPRPALSPGQRGALGSCRVKLVGWVSSYCQGV